jgi:ATPase subunit of ABC transporter with duplicated ATPase domains
MSTLQLQFADQGWHVRWRSASSEEFAATKEAFKATLDSQDRCWDPDAFDGRGGWWVAYSALAEVGHLFSNYRVVREELERQHWQRFERQKQEARERFAQQEQQRRRREQEAESPRQQRQQRQQKKAKDEHKAASREKVTLPKTLEEALALLHLLPPVTPNEIKRAYRAQALRAHPDKGGSHAAMVRINAAYQMALAAC